jgi:hypothetical protein
MKTKLITSLFAIIASIGTICATEGALSGLFSISADKQVQFSRGNLQYQASTDTWRFAESQYVAIGEEGNSNISDTYDGWIDLFGWGTGNNPTLCTGDALDFTTFVDWGTNPISNGGNKENIWRTLTQSEWEYMITSRENANILYGQATINGTHGLVLLPDNWSESNSFIPSPSNWTTNYYTIEEWNNMETLGAVFLPASGDRYGGGNYVYVSYYNEVGSYWFSDAENESNGNDVSIYEYYISCDGNHKDDGQAVRLVKEYANDEGDDEPCGQLRVRTLLIDTTYQPMMVGGYIDGFANANIIKKGIMVSENVSDLVITESTTFENVNFNTASYTTINWVKKYIDCTNIGQEEFIINLTLLEGNQKYYIRTFAIDGEDMIYGEIDSINSQNFIRDKSRRSDQANVLENGSHTLFDLVTDEIIDPQVGYYYSSNENASNVNFRSGTGSFVSYKFLTLWNYKLWYYHNGNHSDRSKMVSLPQMSYTNGLLTISAAETDADKSLTFYYSVDGDGRRPENFTSIYVEPIPVQENSIVYCYAISNENYISYTNAYIVISSDCDNGQSETTNIFNMQNVDNSSAYKFIRNGQLLILRGDKTYTIQGQEVR